MHHAQMPSSLSANASLAEIGRVRNACRTGRRVNVSAGEPTPGRRGRAGANAVTTRPNAVTTESGEGKSEDANPGTRPTSPL